MKRDKDWSLALALVISTGLACFVENRAFFDPFAINDDVRNQAYWLLRILDPALFPHDLAALYFSQPSLISPVLYGLYAITSHWIDPLRLSQFLPILLTVLASFFLFQASTSFLNRRYAFWVTFVFNVYLWTISNMAGGLPRAFFFPLLFLFLWMGSTRRWGWLIPVLFLQALIYPPVLFLSLGILVWNAWRYRRQLVTNPTILKILSIAVIGSLAILAQRYLGELHPHAFGPLVNTEQAEDMAEFYQGGRIEVFRFHPTAMPEGHFLEEVLDLLIRMPTWLQILPLMILLLSWVVCDRWLKRYLGKPPFPTIMWDLIGVSLCLYFIAALSLFILYVPARYIEYTLSFSLVVFIGGFTYLLENKLWHYLPQRNLRIATSSVLVLLGILFTSQAWKPNLIKVYSDQLLLYRYLSHVPKDANIAAPYTIASNIPAFSRRSVLVSREAAIPFHITYYQEMKRRLQDWLSVYYSTDPAVVPTFIAKYRLTYIIINLRDFQTSTIEQLDTLYFNAFLPQFIHRLRAGFPENTYVLTHIPKQCQSFQSGPYIVIPAKAFERQDCLPSSFSAIRNTKAEFPHKKAPIISE